ncbi:carboxypeptidase M32 [Nitrospina watsonii]|uniref:Metal-dependent carboxypeptidase n=1 Tax=Nitrospina watsonii TaxID=1323948 RepID=A0ABM9HDP9_9BACT|nr:carboxypeptidase M32 [Nitrospina watsonii]CAI2718274.1 Metal-dependent carboxypeptidase [Nitrospina watsonii]
MTRNTEISLRGVYDSLVARLQEVHYLNSVMGILHWDQEVIMPPGGGDSRAHQLSTLAGLSHDKFTAPEIGEWLTQLESAPESEFNDVERCNIRETRREYDREVKVPRQLVQELAEMGSRGHHIWVKAREDNDFASFAPFLEKMVELKKQWAHHIDPNRPAYDVNIDVFEQGFTMERIDPVFERLKAELVPLIAAIKDSDYKPDTSFLQGHFPLAEQKALGQHVIRDMGFNFDNGRVDVSVHPFCGGGDCTDVRITTRYREDNFIESLYAAIHETGHALYEQGRMQDQKALPVSEALTTGVHESQSLFWERMIAQQQAFAQRYCSLFAETFPEAFRNVDAHKAYEGINTCQPSFIRVEADEVTYPMHVILRYEIEKGLFDGSMQVQDLPRIWNDKMEAYLGIRPPTDREGVLQDVHWSGGAFGYFPSYTLGAMMACQFYKALEREMPDIRDHIASGNFKVIKEWLNRNVHSKGKLYDTDTLLKQVTGEPFNPSPFIAYLQAKYTAIYRLADQQAGR